MRRKIIRLDPEMLIFLFRKIGEVRENLIDVTLPPDTRIYSVWPETVESKLRICIVIESSEFPEVEEGNPYPELLLAYKPKNQSTIVLSSQGVTP